MVVLNTLLPYSRYGRLTVATLENKVESYEKEIKQLERALERSDVYVEEMEGELKDYRLNACFFKAQDPR